jgi:hypothetical protein
MSGRPLRAIGPGVVKILGRATAVMRSRRGGDRLPLGLPWSTGPRPHQAARPKESVSMFAALAAVAALSVSPSVTAPQHPDAGDDVLFVRYFKDVVERPVSVVEIAVLAPADVRGALDERLMAIGADTAHLRAVGHGDLLFVSVPAERRSGLGVREFVAELLEDPRIPFATPVTFDELGAPRFALPEVFVQFDARIAPARALAIVADSGVGAIVQFDRQPGNVHLVRSTSRNGFELLDAVAALADRPEVLFAECDEVISVFPCLVPNDPLFTYQWQLHNTGQFSDVWADVDLNAPEAWNLHTGTASMIVAVLDDGVQQNHPDINQIAGVNMTNLPGGGGGPLTQYDNHGTAVAGLITATMNNAIGVAGICPGCRTISIKIAYDTTAEWGWTSQASWVADGVWEAASRGAKVTNSSFSGGVSSLLRMPTRCRAPWGSCTSEQPETTPRARSLIRRASRQSTR